MKEDKTSKWGSNVVYSLYILLLILPAFEISLRILGWKPFRHIEYHIQASPENCIISHPALGFALRPGEFEVTINGGLKYSARHGGDSLRVTTHDKARNSLDHIYFFGCSYTYGMGVPDSLSFPFLVQSNIPTCIVKNFGVPGYATLQAYLQIKQLLESNKHPGTVLVNYADFHDERNALTPFYRRDLYIGYESSRSTGKPLMQNSKFPYLSNDPNDNRIYFCHWEQIYKNWKYRETFAIVNFFQEISDRRKAKTIDEVQISRRLFAMIKELCDQNNIRLIVSGITPSEKTKIFLSDLEKTGIETLDIAVDLSMDKYRNVPHDDHPNQAAHAHYAEIITDYLLNGS